MVPFPSLSGCCQPAFTSSGLLAWAAVAPLSRCRWRRADLGWECGWGWGWGWSSRGFRGLLSLAVVYSFFAALKTTIVLVLLCLLGSVARGSHV